MRYVSLRRRSLGFGLIELGISMAIVAVITLMVMPLAVRAMQESKVDEFEAEMLSTTSRVRDYGALVGTFENMTVDEAITHGLIDPSLVQSDSAAATPWGYAITFVPGYVSSATYYNSLGFQFDVDQDLCGSVATGLERNFYKVSIGDATVKNAVDGDTTVDVAAVAKQCAAASGVVTFTFYTAL